MNKVNPDGRKVVAHMLMQMEAVNSRGNQNTMESRKALMDGLSKMHDLTTREKARFVAALNEYIGSAMQGAMLDADAFLMLDAQSLEGVSARLNALDRREYAKNRS
jgi:hypothetical protein